MEGGEDEVTRGIVRRGGEEVGQDDFAADECFERKGGEHIEAKATR